MQKQIIPLIILAAAWLYAANALAGTNDGLLAYYPFDATAEDASGNSYHGTLFGPAGSNSTGPAPVTDRAANPAAAYDFDGTDDRIDTADFGLPDTFSISLWISPDDLSSGQFFLGKHDLSCNNIFLFGIWGGSYAVFIRGQSTSLLPATTGWQHLTVVVEDIGGNSRIHLYRNGQIAAAQNVTGVVGNMAGKAWTIGQEWDSGDTPSNHYNGQMDELRFYNRALLPYEIQALAESGPPMGLHYKAIVKDGLASVDGLAGAHAVDLSPDGGHLYAAGMVDDAVASFSRDVVSGGLNFVEMEQDGVGGVNGLDGVRSLAISPDGKHLYAAGYEDDAVAVFSRDINSGALSYLQVQIDGISGVDGLDGSRSVIISPDGKHLYVAGYTDDAVAVFSRNSSTGALSFVSVSKDNTGGVDGLDGVSSLSLSPDGSHLYVCSALEHSLVVFSRNVSTGELSFIERHQNGIAGVTGLLVSLSVAVSPDGRHVYVAGGGNSAIAIFARNAADGRLTYLEMLQDSPAINRSLYEVYTLTLSPDGKYLLSVTMEDGEPTDPDSKLALFSRDSDSGLLSYVESHQDDNNGINGLGNARAIAASPDGSHIYAAGYSDSALAVFASHYTASDVSSMIAGEQAKWDANDDGQIGLEEAIRALQVVAGQLP